MNDFRRPLYSKYVSRFKAGSAVSLKSNPRIEAYLERNILPQLVDLPVDAPILELGCGSGQLLAILKEAGFQSLEGIDVSPEQVELAREQELPARCEDVFASLESPSQRYRAIVAIDFFEHFDKPELLRLGNLIHEALQDDGLLILQTPNGKSPYALRNIYGDITHLTIFSDESMRQWLGAAGFDEVTVFCPTPGILTWRDAVRVFFRRTILKCLKIKTFLVTGRTEPNLGENIIAVAKRETTVKDS